MLAYFREIGWLVFGIDKNMQIRVSEEEIRNEYNLFACGPLHALHDRVTKMSAS